MRAIAVAGLVAAAAGAGIEIAITGLIIPGVFFVAMPLVLAALLFWNVPWSAPLVAVVAALFLVGNVTYPVTMQRLANPSEVAPFLAALLRTTGLVMAFAGASARSWTVLRQRRAVHD